MICTNKFYNEGVQLCGDAASKKNHGEHKGELHADLFVFSIELSPTFFRGVFFHVQELGGTQHSSGVFKDLKLIKETQWVKKKMIEGAKQRGAAEQEHKEVDEWRGKYEQWSQECG